MENKKNITLFNNIKELIYNSAEKYANNIAFTTKIQKNDEVKYKEITYKQLLNDINCFGTGLYALGLENKRVAVIGKNSYEWIMAHLANLLGGIVSVPLDKGLQLEELENSLIRSKVEAIVFDEKQVANIEEIRKREKTNIKHYIAIGNIEGFENTNEVFKNGKRLLEEGNNNYINKEIDSEKMGLLMFTSGTTSISKAVMLSQKGIATNIYDMQLVETFYTDDVNIAFLPFHHVFGSTGMLVMLACGVKTVFPDGLKYVKKNLKEYGVSVFIGVPLLIDKIYENVQKEIKKQGKEKIVNLGLKISKLLIKFHIDIRRKIFKDIIDGLGGRMRFIISGGAPLDKKVAKRFSEFGMHVVQGYGLTETSPVIAAEGDDFIKPGSIGKPMKHVTLEIINKDDKGIGEIRVKGPNVMLGYYEEEERTKEVLKDGWFYTGDLAYIDNEGFIFIAGRQKDMIVLKNGKKVFPEELEILVNKLEVVEESFVYGIPNEEDANDFKLSVEVVYKESTAKELYGDKTKEELFKIIWNQIKEINKTLPQYKYIKNMVLTTEPLIKTTTEKIKRNEEFAKISKQ